MLARHSSRHRRSPRRAKIVPVPVTPSRRLVLAGALTTGMAALTGCGVRLEDDAPHIPFVPTRDPLPGEAALLAVLGALEGSEEEHAAERAMMLRRALREARVPDRELEGLRAPAAGAETVAAFEGALRDCGPGLLPLVGRLTATRRILGDAEPAALWTPAPTSPWQAGAVAAEALDATRATVYALDLVAARTSGASSTSVLRASRGLRDLVTRQTSAAGDAAPETTLGYDVPHELTAAEARELGSRSFERLLAAYADGLAGLGDDRDAALEVTEWMVTAERLSRGRFPLEVPVLYGQDPEDS